MREKGLKASQLKVLTQMPRLECSKKFLRVATECVVLNISIMNLRDMKKKCNSFVLCTDGARKIRPKSTIIKGKANSKSVTNTSG